MTIVKSHRRQFLRCCVFWGKEYLALQQNCSCCEHHLPPISPFHSNCLAWSQVQSCMPYIQPMHGHAIPFFTATFPSGFYTIKQKRPPQMHLTLLWTMDIISRLSATGAMSKQRTSQNLKKSSNVWHLEQNMWHLTCRTINGTIPSLSLFHSWCSSPTAQAFLKLG